MTKLLSAVFLGVILTILASNYHVRFTCESSQSSVAANATHKVVCGVTMDRVELR